MRMADFTLGPLTPHLDGFYITDAEGCAICEVNAIGIPRSTAYTNLFAVSPEMLEALNNLVNMADSLAASDAREYMYHRDLRVIERARQVLAKADGKEVPPCT